MPSHASEPGPPHKHLAIRAAALATIAFYVATAPLTKGHEADFGKQWLAARLVVTGQGRQLFDQRAQRGELERHFTPDVINRGIWREGIGGPTYPPTLAVAFAPLGWLPPRSAQFVVVEMSVALVVVSSVFLSRWSAGRVSWEQAALATLTLPSFFLGVGVGQNSAMSLAVLAGGLCAISRGRDLQAGLIWGLFAVKPTWGVAVAWVPAVLGRPRAYFGMAVSAIALVLFTLPFCGLRSWLDWLAVAHQTEIYYQTLPRWTALSRDVPALIRRMAQDPLGEGTAWAAVLLILVVTAFTWWTGRRLEASPTVRIRTTCLAAGIILTCPRFMFYDMTLAVVPFLAAVAEWSELERQSRAILVMVGGLFWIGTGLSYATQAMLGPPVETAALLLLWLWSVNRLHDNVRQAQYRHSATIDSPVFRLSNPG